MIPSIWCVHELYFNFNKIKVGEHDNYYFSFILLLQKCVEKNLACCSISTRIKPLPTVVAHGQCTLGEGNGTPLQHSCLDNPMDAGAWQAVVHGVARSQTQLSDFPFLFTFMHWRSKWPPTPVFLPGESQGWGSLVGFRLWGRTESDTTEATQQQQQQCMCTDKRSLFSSS